MHQWLTQSQNVPLIIMYKPVILTQLKLNSGHHMLSHVCIFYSYPLSLFILYHLLKQEKLFSSVTDSKKGLVGPQGTSSPLLVRMHLNCSQRRCFVSLKNDFTFCFCSPQQFFSVFLDKWRSSLSFHSLSRWTCRPQALDDSTTWLSAASCVVCHGDTAGHDGYRWHQQTKQPEQRTAWVKMMNLCFLVNRHCASGSDWFMSLQTQQTNILNT